jgi:hypothetical protein
MPSSNKRDVSPLPLGEKLRPGCEIYQRFASDYRSVSPVAERKAKPKPKAKSEYDMVARLESPGNWDLPPGKM